jgi:hypothetical protein
MIAVFIEVESYLGSRADEPAIPVCVEQAEV